MLADGKIDAIAEAAGRKQLYEQSRQYLRELAPGRVAQLAPYVQSPTPQVRLAVVEALGASGDPAAIAIVRPAQQDADVAVARAAVHAVALLQ
jgi:HEAT repeat protein